MSADNRIAIIGMAGRFSGCPDLSSFWDAIITGRSCISSFDNETLLARGVNRETLDDSMFVPCGGYLEDFECFDAEFFAILPREAEAMDPQQRLFLEIAYAAIEDAGQVVGTEPLPIGVFAGTTINTYFIENVIKHKALAQALGPLQLMIANDKDFLSLRTSYLLNLDGPSMTVQTACSTSLAAVHLACSSLLLGECEMALAGGSSLRVPHGCGYMYQPGGTSAPDGRCRPFDADASGSVVGSGAGAVILKRYSDAVRDGDRVRAVILGSALTNDGAGKRFFSMPSAEGQARAIAEAQKVAGVEANSIGYIEAHGTGTIVGDPIEFEGLSRAFRLTTSERGYCGLGSVKANIGHLDAAAGVAGLIKTVLLLENRKLPPLTDFVSVNRSIDIDASPFFIPTQASEWSVPEGRSRRAGVTSIGLGGANVHVVVEEAPKDQGSREYTSSLGERLTLISAKTEDALDRSTKNFARYLSQDVGDGQMPSIGAVARTLQLGRSHLPVRRAVFAESIDDLRSALADASNNAPSRNAITTPKPVFLFTGQGSQYGNMGRQLAESFPKFRDKLLAVIDEVQPFVDFSLRDILLGADSKSDADIVDLAQTQFTQPVLFTLQVALAQTLIGLGISPAGTVGHSVGEIACAVISGSLSVRDGGYLAAQRGLAAASCSIGQMLAVAMDEAAARGRCSAGIELAAINSPTNCVLSGDASQIAKLAAELEVEGIPCQILQTSHGFHSVSMEPAAERLRTLVAELSFDRPEIPFYSTLTGAHLSEECVPHGNYWARQIREPVLFAAAIAASLSDGATHFIEIGPGRALSAFVREILAQNGITGLPLVSTLHFGAGKREDRVFVEALGECWSTGIAVDLNMLWQDTDMLPAAVSLPTYPFKRTRHWLDASGPDQLVVEQPLERPAVKLNGGVSPAMSSVPQHRMAADLKDLRQAVVSLSRVVGRHDGGIVSEAEWAPVSDTVERSAQMEFVAEPGQIVHSSQSTNVPVAEKLAEIFEGTFGVIPSGNRALAEYGIDSLALAQIFARVRRECGVEIDRSQLGSSPNYATILRLAEEASRDTAAPNAHTRAASLDAPTIDLVIAACSELLGVDGITADTDLMATGAHSLMLTQLTTRLRNLCAVQVKIGDVFEARTPGAIAALIDQGRAAPKVNGAKANNERSSKAADSRVSSSELQALLSEVDSLSRAEKDAFLKQAEESGALS
jgi:acyl transferase domain-containing protein